MNLLKEVLTHEVYPALGCTEPVSCAYATATAAAQLGEPVADIVLRVNPGTYKNGAAVTVPHAGGGKGNPIAAALGAVLAQPDAKLELLQHVTPEILQDARRLLDAGKLQYECLDGQSEFRIEAVVSSLHHSAECVLAGSHTHIERIVSDGRTIHDGGSDGDASLAYREVLKKTDLQTLLALAEGIDAADREFLQSGIDMNLAMAEHGFEVGRTAWQLRQMNSDGVIAADVFYHTKVSVASAVDGRMAGAQRPAMTSGGSGNQGILAILTPVIVGREMGVDAEQIIRSLAVAHIVNAYIKCFIGELSVICGCAMAAGIASAAAIVYQQAGLNMEKITLAINSVIGDLGGLICDGAKPGCAMKAVTSVDTAIRSGLMAIRGYGLTDEDGMVGQTAEDSIHNLGRIALEGMFPVDPTVVNILKEKAGGWGRA